MVSKNHNSLFRVVKGALLLVVLALILLSLACGSSRKGTETGEESVDIDDLLGEEDIAKSNRSSDEAEVLRLLGITPADEATEPKPTTVSNTPAPEAEMMEGELDKLREDLVQKDQEISDLRAQLTQKEMKISDLEAKANTGSPTRSIPVSGIAGEPSREFQLRYQEGLNQFKARNYQAALGIFTELLQADASNSLSDNCQYWIGESYYGMQNYNQAIAEFEKVFSFANSNKTDDSQLKLGLCYVRLGDKTQARAEFDRLLSAYPDSEYRSMAQRYIARL